MKILVFDLNFIGDLILGSPFYRALKEGFPWASIESLAWNHSADILRTNPYIDKIHRIKWLSQTLVFRGYDIAITTNTSLKTSLAMIPTAKITVGYNYAGKGIFHSKAIPIAYPTLRGQNRTDEVCALAEALSLKVRDRRPIMEISRGLDLYAVNALSHQKPPIVGVCMNTGHHRQYREWDQHKWIDLCQKISKDYCSLVFLGEERDCRYVSEVVGICGGLDLSGRTSILEAAAIVNRCDLFLSVNTAPMHMAVASRTPTLAIIGRTPAYMIYPQADHRFRYLEDPALEHYDPYKLVEIPSRLNEITVDDAYREIKKLYEQLTWY